MKISVIGNCQSVVVTHCLNAMLPGHRIRRGYSREIASGAVDLSELLQNTDMAFVQTSMESKVRDLAATLANPPVIKLYPEVYFTGFHPDLVYARSAAGNIVSPLVNYNSAICLFGWMNGISEEDIRRLFNGDVFARLGYFDYFEQSKTSFLNLAQCCGMSLDYAFDYWTKSGVFMHSVNHPSLRMLADISRAALRSAEIEPTIQFPEYYMSDSLIRKTVWPIYPEVAERLGLPGGEYIFKKTSDERANVGFLDTMDLETFIGGSYKLYESLDKSSITCQRFNDGRFDILKKWAGRSKPASGKSENPYSSLPDYQFWKKAVVQPAYTEVDPVTKTKFRIGPSTKVATAGSCFAQHIARTLQNSGYSYYVTEDGGGLTTREAINRNYGVFSARYGNLYTARQLHQLFDRAYGTFEPQDSAWSRADGQYVDPFRPQVEPDGFDSPEDVAVAREEHLGFVREMFENTNIFVFTLGLTEAWRSKLDGAVFPLAPGVAGGAVDAERYEFINFTATDVTLDIEAFLEKLKKINPNVKVILTVSPVPLIATYENRHALVATTYSKSVLRVAADDIARSKDWVDYFPSYEIITGAFNRGAYFEDDLRSVTESGVAHVMGRFLFHYSEEAGSVDFKPSKPSPKTTKAKKTSDAGAKSLDAIEKELEEGRQIICDEEVIVADLD